MFGEICKWDREKAADIFSPWNYSFYIHCIEYFPIPFQNYIFLKQRSLFHYICEVPTMCQKLFQLNHTLYINLYILGSQ